MKAFGQDLVGRKLGRLTVLRCSRGHDGRTIAECRCECGTVKIFRPQHLKSGDTVSCGCLRIENMKRAQLLSPIKHGLMRKGRLHYLVSTYRGMIDRCENPNNLSFSNYGGRGISVCDRWRSNFAMFLSDVGDRPSRSHTLDRIDNDGNYAPGNVRWATRLEQMSHNRRSRFLTLSGETKTISEWARILGIHASTIHGRLSKGWTTERALTAPRGQ